MLPSSPFVACHTRLGRPHFSVSGVPRAPRTAVSPSSPLRAFSSSPRTTAAVVPGAADPTGADRRVAHVRWYGVVWCVVRIVPQPHALRAVARRRGPRALARSREVSAGLAIHDVMEGIASPVRTVCLGRAQSMAAVLLAAGAKGSRCLAPSATAMVHQPTWDLAGARPALAIALEAAEIEGGKARFVALLARHTGRTDAEVGQRTRERAAVGRGGEVRAAF